jgi:hypothetical protein
MKKILALCVAATLAIGMAAGAYASEKKSQQEVNGVPPTVQALKFDAPTQVSVVAPVHQVVAVPSLNWGEAKAKLDAGDVLGAIVALLFGGGGVGLAMTTLAANKPRAYELGDMSEIPVIASDIIYEGAIVGDNGTFQARPLVGGDRFVGVAQRKADNSTGAAGAVNVLVRAKGHIVGSFAAIAAADMGKAVYASDDDTLSITESTNSYIGKAVRFINTNSAVVAFDVEDGGTIAELVDSTGGTAAASLVAISATATQAQIMHNFASLAAKVNSLLRMSKGG